LIPLALPEQMSEGGLSIVVVAFQSVPGAPLQHAALPLTAHPRRIEVPDGCDCELPERLPLGREAIRACFQLDGRVVLVPDLATLFGAIQ
jgi:hypothetical protein